MVVDRGSLPPGWEMKWDAKRGKAYFIDHTTKVTTWLDPRQQPVQDQPQQPTVQGQQHHQSQHYHGQYQQYASYQQPTNYYQPQNIHQQHGNQQYPHQQASVHQHHHHHQQQQQQQQALHQAYPLQPQYAATAEPSLQDAAPLARQTAADCTPRRPREEHLQQAQPLRASPHAVQPHHNQSTSLGSGSMTSHAYDDSWLERPTDCNEAALRICSLFPHVEQHTVNDLLTKYRSREEVVIAALSVSPLGAEPERDHNMPTESDDYTSKISAMFPTVSEERIRELLKRYLKSVFPKAEESLLLDVLVNCDNSVHKAGEKLKDLGYDKSMTPVVPPRFDLRHQRDVVSIRRSESPQLSARSPRILSEADRQQVRTSLAEEFPAVPEAVRKLALESAVYDLERARTVLEGMSTPTPSTRETDPKPATSEQSGPTSVAEPSTGPSPKHTSPRSPRRVSRAPSGSTTSPLASPCKRASKSAANASAVGREAMEYRSRYRTAAKGPNPSCVRGPQSRNLLSDYIAWSGPDPDIRRGPDVHLRAGPRPGHAKGSDPTLRRGPACKTIKQYVQAVRQALVTSL